LFILGFLKLLIFMSVPVFTVFYVELRVSVLIQIFKVWDLVVHRELEGHLRFNFYYAYLKQKNRKKS